MESNKMLDKNLEQLESLISELIQQNDELSQNNAQIKDEVTKLREENDSLQLSLMEQEERQNSTNNKLQNLIQRVNESRTQA